MADSPGKRKTAKNRKSLATRAVHAGEPRKRYADSITTPIIQTSTFTFANTKAIEDYTKKGKMRYEYARYGNPTATIAEARLADLEGAEDCVVFSSGMSAITTTILSLVQSGDHIVITDDSYKKNPRILQIISKAVRNRMHHHPVRRLPHLRKSHKEEHPIHLLRVTHKPVPEHLRPRQNQKNRRPTQRPHTHRLHFRHTV